MRTTGGTAGNRNCVFPYMYKGVLYDKCTRSGPNDTPWCRSETGGWGYCRPQGEPLGGLTGAGGVSAGRKGGLLGPLTGAGGATAGRKVSHSQG